MPAIKNTILDGGDSLEKSGRSGGTVHQIEFEITFEIWADTCAQTISDIAETPGLHTLGQVVSVGNQLAYCTRRQFSDSQTITHPVTGVLTRLWKVVCQFSNNFDSVNDAISEPTDRRPKISWSSETIEKVVDIDLDGIPIQNFVGEPIPLTRKQIIPILNIRRYEPSPYQPLRYLLQSYVVNALPFIGAPRGTVLLEPQTAEEVSEDGQRFAIVNYTFKFNFKENYVGAIASIIASQAPINDLTPYLQEDTWKDLVLHEGTRYRRGYTAEEISSEASEAAKAGRAIRFNDASYKLEDALDSNGDRTTVNLGGTIENYPAISTNDAVEIFAKGLGFRVGSDGRGTSYDPQAPNYTSQVGPYLQKPQYLAFRNVEYFDFESLLLNLGGM